MVFLIFSYLKNLLHRKHHVDIRKGCFSFSLLGSDWISGIRNKESTIFSRSDCELFQTDNYIFFIWCKKVKTQTSKWIYVQVLWLYYSYIISVVQQDRSSRFICFIWFWMWEQCLTCISASLYANTMILFLSSGYKTNLARWHGSQMQLDYKCHIVTLMFYFSSKL